MTASALDLIRQVESLGGQVALEGDQLRVTAPHPLPEELMTALGKEKPAILLALGASFDSAINSILSELRPQLSAPLQKLSDTKLLALINWSVMEAWVKTLRKLEHHGA